MRRARKTINQINVVPYIDVMLVLLVIFMVTAPLVTPGEIELPSVGSAIKPPLQPLEITVKGRDVYELRDRQDNTTALRLGPEQLLAMVLNKQRAEQPVVIAADKSAIYDDVMKVVDALQQKGVKRVGLLARPASTK